jgi:flagellar hook protein FlgE
MTLRQFTQGAVQTTNGPLDVAIQGDGFLVVKTSEDATVYTRGGHLKVDSNGYLLTSTNDRVQGWTQQDGQVDITGPIGDISVPVGSVGAPVPTTSFSFDANLSATAPEGTRFARSVTIYDSLGSSHLVTLAFTKTADSGEWDYELSIPDAEVDSPVSPLTGTLTFDENGQLTSPTSTDDAPVLQITGLVNGAAPIDLTWSLFKGTTPRLTQFDQASSVSANSQDGSPAAELTRVGIGDGGVILAQYSNGKQSVVGQLALASIRNPESLISIGNNNYQLSARTALPAVGMPSSGGRGSIIGGAVENSTVDLAKEFTNLIVLQRGYQANAKVVTTVDELSQETLSLKR